MAETKKPGANKPAQTASGSAKAKPPNETKASKAKASPKDAKTTEEKPKARKPPAKLYLFRVELKGIKPKIWRRFYVPSNLNLHEFHRVLQYVMGWSNYHLYSFTLQGQEYYEAPNEDDDDCIYTLRKPIPPRMAKLSQLGLEKGRAFNYLYDMGDSWAHAVKVMNTDYVPAEPGHLFGCIAGERACPPEDCGGVWGYQKLLDHLANPDSKDKEKDEEVEWYNIGDPDAFDIEDVNTYLHRIKNFKDDTFRG
jgi:hypothetical protein